MPGHYKPEPNETHVYHNDGTHEWYGWASSGTLTSHAHWQIVKIEYNTGYTTQGDPWVEKYPVDTDTASAGCMTTVGAVHSVVGNRELQLRSGVVLELIEVTPRIGCVGLHFKPFRNHMGIGATIMPTGVSEKLDWKYNKGDPCECNKATDDIKKMGYEVKYMHHITALCLDYV